MQVALILDSNVLIDLQILYLNNVAPTLPKVLKGQKAMNADPISSQFHFWLSSQPWMK